MDIKHIAILFSIVCFLSCKNNSSFSDFETVRSYNIEINEKARKSLNEITKLLDGSNALYNKNIDSDVAIITQYQVYFNLTNSNNNLYIRQVLWNDIAQMKPPVYVDYELPIEEIDETNIEIQELNLPIFGGEYANFTINSKLNNPDAFGYRNSKYTEDNGKIEIKNISKRSYIIIPLKVDVAYKLKEQLIILTENYKK